MKKELIFSVLLSTFTFLLGILLGYFLIGLETQNLFKKYQELNILISSAYYSLKDVNTCDISGLDILGKKLDELGYQIELLENAENPFKDYNRIKILKSYYFNLQYLHYLLAKDMLKNCNESINIIIFFYLPDKYCKSCKEQGYQLIHLKKKYSQKVLIYSYDLSYPNYFIYYYKEKYKIRKVPFIILITKNYTRIFKGFTRWEEIDKYLIT